MYQNFSYKKIFPVLLFCVALTTAVFANSWIGLAFTEKKEKKRGVVCSVRDASGRLKPKCSNRDWIANVSHELRTPVTGIKGAVETVFLYPTLDPEMRNRLLKMAMDECDRMTRIIEDFSNPDRNGVDYRTECFETVGFLDRVYDILEAAAEKRGHTFIKNYPRKLPMLMGDPEKLQQVFMNILTNAVKYTEAGGRISMEARKEEKGIWICVSDNGIGIPQEDIQHLFERSYRAETARKMDLDGAGLGLAISKEIVDAHGGKIEIESALGEGTCVRVFLPYKSEVKKGENKTEG